MFAASQFSKGADAPLPGQLPERGVVEIKSVAEDGWLVAGGAQVSKYWEKYRLVLPAPYVVAHLQLGLLLHQWGATLYADPATGQAERLGVYLTNALTGWQPPDEDGKKRMAQLALDFPELMAENSAARVVKQERRILVILGTPPYNGFAGVAVDEEQELTRAYRQTRRAPPPQGQGLNDLYVRFYRMAERHIVEHSGRGVICFISNYSWLAERPTRAFCWARNYLISSRVHDKPGPHFTQICPAFGNGINQVLHARHNRETILILAVDSPHEVGVDGVRVP